MTVQALTHTSVDRPVSGLWDILVAVKDAHGVLTDAVPVVTITLPAGSTATPTVQTVSTGIYCVSYVVGTSGRYIARAVASGLGAVDFACYVNGTVAATAMPDVDAFRDYEQDGASSWTDEAIQDALDAEAAAQRAMCRVPADYTADLRQALLRRVQRNLAMRKFALAVPSGDSDIVPIFGRDPEVRRLEAPYRKLVFG